jgi:ribosomal protein S18 acetylase RimI-like enzyme
VNNGYIIRNMTRDELDTVAEWAAAEGWNPGDGDAEAFFAADPDGFYLGLLDGEPIASISCVTYSPDYAFLGFYIVQPPHRGKGYGMQIWQHAMARVTARNIGLDGVVDQQDSYRRSGFVLAHGNMRHVAAASTMAKAPGANVVDLVAAGFARLFRYDCALFPAQRPSFLSAWLERPGVHTLVHLADGKLDGYGVIRPATDGFRIGPLFADTPHVAQELCGALAAHVPSEGAVYLDVPLTNEAAIALATGLGMTPVFETARMYTSGEPDVAIDRVYGITSLELG